MRGIRGGVVVELLDLGMSSISRNKPKVSTCGTAGDALSSQLKYKHIIQSVNISLYMELSALGLQ